MMFAIALLAAAAPVTTPRGYIPISPQSQAAVRGAADAWRACVLYGIRQVDDPKEPASTIAEAALAGCVRAETNLADRVFEGMKIGHNPLEARAMADSMIPGLREEMRGQAIRWVLRKHRSDRARTTAPRQR